MKRLASVLRTVVLAAALVSLVSAVLAVIQPNFEGRFGVMNLSVEGAEIEGLPAWLRGVAVVIPALAFVYAMARLAGLLRLAARNEVFSAPAAAHLRSFGVWLLVATVAGKLLPLAAHVLDLWWYRGGHGNVQFTLTSDDFWNLFVSTLFMLVARVLSEAYRIAEENRQFI